jgi:hypothetical protein
MKIVLYIAVSGLVLWLVWYAFRAYRQGRQMVNPTIRDPARVQALTRAPNEPEKARMRAALIAKIQSQRPVLY